MGLKEERVLLLQAWKECEANAIDKGGNPTSVELKFPRKLKMRRMIETDSEGGGDKGWEEYYEYHFPDDDKGIGKR